MATDGGRKAVGVCVLTETPCGWWGARVARGSVPDMARYGPISTRYEQRHRVFGVESGAGSGEKGRDVLWASSHVT